MTWSDDKYAVTIQALERLFPWAPSDSPEAAFRMHLIALYMDFYFHQKGHRVTPYRPF
jgi:hypothetical protein